MAGKPVQFSKFREEKQKKARARKQGATAQIEGNQGDEKWTPPVAGHSRIAKYMGRKEQRELEERQYRPEDFYVSATDENGHSEKWWTKLHPMMANAILMLIQRGNFPFDNQQAFVRVACQELLSKCYQLEKVGGVPNYVPRLKAISLIAAQAKDHLAFNESLHSVDEVVKMALLAGHQGQAAKMIFDVLAEAKQIPEKSYRDFYVNTIKQRYGHLLKGERVKTMRPSRKTREQEQAEEEEHY